MVSNNNKLFYYMVGSTSGQDEANPVFWLATQAGKMGLYLACLGLPTLFP